MFELKVTQLLKDEKTANQQNEITVEDIDKLLVPKRAVKLDFMKMDGLKDLILCLPELHEFVTGIEVGQKLVLDISKETMRKIQSGELKLMHTKSDVLKAVICNPNGTIVQHMDVKYENFCNIPNPAGVANSLQMASINQQLATVKEQLEMVGFAVQEVIAGQQNDRIALYYAGEQIYLEASKTQNEFLKMQLTASAIRSLEEAKSKMVESIKLDIAQIKAYDRQEIKLKPREVSERISRINKSFDVVNRAALLKAGIYHELDEIPAMMTSLQQYAGFLSESINANAKLLYDYDKSDTKIEGKWHERACSIPQSIQLMIENHEQDQQLLEIEYDTLQKAGWINEQ